MMNITQNQYTFTMSTIQHNDLFAKAHSYRTNAFIDHMVRDPKDGEVGLVGYEINFNRYFYKYVPPRPLHEIDADLKASEARIQALLREVAE
jgi:hypothetical protein